MKDIKPTKLAGSDGLYREARSGVVNRRRSIALAFRPLAIQPNPAAKAEADRDKRQSAHAKDQDRAPLLAETANDRALRVARIVEHTNGASGIQQDAG
ncbi:hypothetical protein ACV229_23835 [Burkholderia sp. MR1-5-21]